MVGPPLRTLTESIESSIDHPNLVLLAESQLYEDSWGLHRISLGNSRRNRRQEEGRFNIQTITPTIPLRGMNKKCSEALGTGSSGVDVRFQSRGSKIAARHNPELTLIRVSWFYGANCLARDYLKSGILQNPPSIRTKELSNHLH